MSFKCDRTSDSLQLRPALYFTVQTEAQQRITGYSNSPAPKVASPVATARASGAKTRKPCREGFQEAQPQATTS